MAEPRRPVVSSNEVRTRWDDLLRQGNYEAAVEAAIEIIDGANEADGVEVAKAYRPLVMTLELMAEVFPQQSDGFWAKAEKYCSQMLTSVPGDAWALKHLRNIRKQTHEGRVYENRCWKCHEGITSLLSPKCKRCQFYQCRNCAACLCGYTL